MTKKNDINNEFNTESKITKQKIFSFLCYLLFVFDIFFLIWNIFHCTNMIYPHLSMGIDVFNWKEQYKINLIFFAIIF